jgi:hypothetical protein
MLMCRWSSEWVDAGEDCVSPEDVLKRPSYVQRDHELSVGSNLLVNVVTLESHEGRRKT